jgi:hypothetical protein
MRRYKPLQRRTPLRSKKPFWMRTKRPEGKLVLEEKKPKPKFKRSTLRRVSKAMTEKLREYKPVQREFLSKPENRYCAICLCVGRNPPQRATEVHHKFGRAGRLLTDPRGFIASCFPCRELPHSNPKWARSVGILAEARDWNRYAALDEIFGVAA